jgi:hypothetical protein
MLDYYFRRPLIWDYTFALVIAIFFYLLSGAGRISRPPTEMLYSLVSDLATICLTLAGFVITLLTVLVAFKSSEKTPINEIVPGKDVFEAFFKTDLYFQTVKHLRNATASLTCIAVAGFCLKLFLRSDIEKVLYLFNIVGITILCLTLIRCLIILSKIIKLQRQ